MTDITPNWTNQNWNDVRLLTQQWANLRAIANATDKPPDWHMADDAANELAREVKDLLGITAQPTAPPPLPTMRERVTHDLITSGRLGETGLFLARSNHLNRRRKDIADDLQQMRLPDGIRPRRERKGEPLDPARTVAVMNALVKEARSWENSAGFYDWDREYGDYEAEGDLTEDIRRRVYRAVQVQTDALRLFLGDAYPAYLWATAD